ncbi:MAG: hypothetical protein MZV65_39670 [Chromatiales bacterium]|nr:hypothetical protein [Chromatiales bacterium]MCK7581155.1 hypothetical protein [Chromatiales bacterium]
MKHSDSALEALQVFLENMVGEALLAKQVGLDVGVSEVVSASFQSILKIAREDLPLAHLLDTSDLVFHVEGPGANHDAPWLSAFRWLTVTLDQTVRHLSSEVLDLLGANGRQLARKLDVRLTGVAPGSLWVGTKIETPEADLLPADPACFGRLVEAMTALPALVEFIGDERLLPGIGEAVVDPALRDASLMALLKLAPSGKNGIHTLLFSSSEHQSARLSQRERVVLNSALKSVNGLTHSGEFVGQVRSADLDRSRLHLRTPHGTLRCVLTDLPESQARNVLGRTVSVAGRYAADRDGRPRLMQVASLQVRPDPEQLEAAF